MTAVVVLGDERGLVPELESRSILTVVRHAHDQAEALAVIGSGLANVVIVAGPASTIDTAFVEALQRVGGRGVALVSSELDTLRLKRLGLAVIPYEAHVQEVEGAVAQLAFGATEHRAPQSPLGVLEHPPSRSRSGVSGVGQAEPQERGRITTVWGTGGAPGRSLVALNLAVESALQGKRTVLVDADTYAASLASCLGLLDETAGLVRLCRSVDQGAFDPQRDSEAFARVPVAGTFMRFTSGLPRSERWAEVSARSLGRALDAVARVCDEVIVDVAAPASQDDELSLDSFAPQRNDATLAAIGASDRLFAVGLGDPVNLPRLVRLCEEAAVLPAGPRPRLILNRVRASTSGKQPERSITRAWERFGPKGLTPSVFLPNDPAAADACLMRGKPLAETAPRSSLRRAIAALVA